MKNTTESVTTSDMIKAINIKESPNKEDLKRTVTIVIPTLNEAQAIRKVIQELIIFKHGKRT